MLHAGVTDIKLQPTHCVKSNHRTNETEGYITKRDEIDLCAIIT